MISGLLSAAAMAAVLGSVEAQEAPQQQGNFDFGTTATTIWSSNIALAPTNLRQGTIGQLAIDLDYQESTRRLRTDLKINAAARHYFNGDFNDTLIGGLNGGLYLAIVPERFEWIVQDTFGQVLSNQFAAPTAGNLNNVNYLTTGPDLTFELGSALSVLLSGRYATTNYSRNGADNERLTGAMSLIRNLNDASDLSLTAKSDQLEYSGVVGNSLIHRDEIALGYGLRSSRTSAQFEAGYAKVTYGALDSATPVARITLRRRVSASTAFRLQGGVEYSDSGIDFRDAQTLNGVRLDATTIVPALDVYRREFVATGLEVSRPRTSFGVTAELRRESHVQYQILNRTDSTVRIYAGRRLGPTMEVQGDAEYRADRLSSSGSRSNRTTGTARWLWRPNRALTWNLEYTYRNNASPAGYAKYHEHQVAIAVRWTPTPKP